MLNTSSPSGVCYPAVGGSSNSPLHASQPPPQHMLAQQNNQNNNQNNNNNSNNNNNNNNNSNPNPSTPSGSHVSSHFARGSSGSGVHYSSFPSIPVSFNPAAGFPIVYNQVAATPYFTQQLQQHHKQLANAGNSPMSLNYPVLHSFPPSLPYPPPSASIPVRPYEASAYAANNSMDFARKARHIKSPSQLKQLKTFYNRSPRPTKEDIKQLQHDTSLPSAEITRWFRNERHKEKKTKEAMSEAIRNEKMKNKQKLLKLAEKEKMKNDDSLLSGDDENSSDASSSSTLSASDSSRIDVSTLVSSFRVLSGVEREEFLLTLCKILKSHEVQHLQSAIQQHFHSEKSVNNNSNNNTAFTTTTTTTTMVSATNASSTQDLQTSTPTLTEVSALKSDESTVSAAVPAPSASIVSSPLPLPVVAAPTSTQSPLAALQSNNHFNDAMQPIVNNNVLNTPTAVAINAM